AAVATGAPRRRLDVSGDDARLQDTRRGAIGVWSIARTAARPVDSRGHDRNLRPPVLTRSLLLLTRPSAAGADDTIESILARPISPGRLALLLSHSADPGVGYSVGRGATSRRAARPRSPRRV